MLLILLVLDGSRLVSSSPLQLVHQPAIGFA